MLGRRTVFRSSGEPAQLAEERGQCRRHGRLSGAAARRLLRKSGKSVIRKVWVKREDLLDPQSAHGHHGAAIDQA